MSERSIAGASMRFRGERRPAVVMTAPMDGAAVAELARAAEAHAAREDAALVCALVPSSSSQALEALGWEMVGPVPTLVRPLRMPGVLGGVPLLAPFGRRRRSGVREVTDLPADVRITRLWDRFSIDVGFALERTTKLFAWRTRPTYRVLILEDGDRYAIRALCIFAVDAGGASTTGHVVELLHDRSVTGMRAASHLLGLALRAMNDGGATSARAVSLPHSGSYPIFARHGFFGTVADDARVLLVKTRDTGIDDGIVSRDRWYLSYVDRLDV